jgi:hypothetical protein
LRAAAKEAAKNAHASIAIVASTVLCSEAARDAGFQIDDVEPRKFFSPAAPATMPLRLIKARI